MCELKANEIKQINGGSRLVKLLRWLALESDGGAGGDRYGAGGWRP